MRYLRQLAIFFLLMIACSFLIWLVYTDIEAKTITQVDSEQMVHAEQAAQGILRFFATYNNTLSFLAGDRHIITMDADGRHMMQEFYRTHAGEISSITRVDENGIILYTYPFESSTGANISGQGHVRQELTTRKVVTSDVFTSVQGFRTVAMHMPVFDGSTFRGSIAILIPFDALAGAHVAPIHIPDHGYGWVISRESGIILYSPLPNQTGRPVSEVFADSPDVREFVALVMNGESGISSYTIGQQQSVGRPVTYEAVYHQVRVGNSGWSIIVTTPRDEILLTLQTLQRNLMVIFVILGISLFFFTYYIVRARGIVREEAKRKVAEDALRESEKKYRNIIANMQDAFYRTDRDGNITMVSPSTVRLLGAGSEDELLNKPMAAFYAEPRDRESTLAALRERGLVTNHEVQLKRADGTVITGLANSHLLRDRDGSFCGIEGIIRNVSDRKRTENALAQATKKLNLLTAITLNDIRNALFTLSGYLELGNTQRTEEKQAEFHQKEKALLHQIDLQLTMARNYQSLGISPPRWHAVSTTFILALSHLGPSDIKRNLGVDNLEIYADPLLEVVFQNLAENVLHHAPSATAITLRYEKTTEGFSLIFEDNGPGIPDDKKEAVFQRGAVTRNGSGLFMVREILEITGISIRETGEHGKGARFRMDIPRDGYRFSDAGPEA
jgi:PAS domain S-box-containing protein